MLMRRLLAFAAASLWLSGVSGCDQGVSKARVEQGLKPAIALAGRVTDAAHILTASDAASLTGQSEALEKATKHQLVVVTVPSLGGQDIALYTRNLARAWGIGRKDFNDGVVVLVALNEHKVRIAVGYGLEQVLTPAVCSEIIERDMVPSFKAGNRAWVATMGSFDR